MNKDDICKLLQQQQSTLRELGIQSLTLFGSVARGENNPESDVDLLVELSQPHTFDRYIQAKFFLEDILGCQVDLVMSEALKPRVRVTVERDAFRAA